jgi:hypothetical protein
MNELAGAVQSGNDVVVDSSALSARRRSSGRAGLKESEQFDAYEVQFRQARASLEFAVQRSRLPLFIQAVDVAVGDAVRERTIGTAPKGQRYDAVLRQCDALRGVVTYFSHRGDRYFDRELRCGTMPHPTPVGLAGTDEPPGYLQALYVRRKVRRGVRRIQRRIKKAPARSGNRCRQQEAPLAAFCQ